jgi:hypothetical protein
MKERKRSGPSAWRTTSGGAHIGVSIRPAGSTGQESGVHVNRYSLADSTHLILQVLYSFLRF